MSGDQWVPSVAHYAGPKRRGLITKPWSLDSGRVGHMAHVCAHDSHKTDALALACAQRFADDLNARSPW